MRHGRTPLDLFPPLLAFPCGLLHATDSVSAPLSQWTLHSVLVRFVLLFVTHQSPPGIGGGPYLLMPFFFDKVTFAALIVSCSVVVT